jgi:hypothetical protein
MVTWSFENGCKIGFDKVLDMFQPYVTDGTSRQSISLLLEEDQIYKAEEILKKIDATKMCFEFFTVIATGGFRMSMKNDVRIYNQPFRDSPGYRIN